MAVGFIKKTHLPTIPLPPKALALDLKVFTQSYEEVQPAMTPEDYIANLKKKSDASHAETVKEVKTKMMKRTAENLYFLERDADIYLQDFKVTEEETGDNPTTGAGDLQLLEANQN